MKEDESEEELEEKAAPTHINFTWQRGKVFDYEAVETLMERI